MELIFLKIVNMSINAGWLVLAIILLRAIFRRMPKWIVCLLWGLVAIRLICPFSIESVLSLIPSAETLPQEITYTAHPQIQSGIVIIDQTINPVLASSLKPAEYAVSANPTQIWSFVFSCVWIAGMGGMFLYAAISYLLLKYRVRTAVPLEKGIRISEMVVSPFVLGFLKPVIYLPFGIEPGDLPYVVAHERTHIRRKDHWWKPLGFLLLSVYWFHPILWIAYILLCRDIEAACDEKVIKDMEIEQLRAYSTALLNCSVHRRRIAACPLAFGETGVKTRIRWIMHYRKPAVWVVSAALIVSAVVAVCFLTNPKMKDDGSTEPAGEMNQIIDTPQHNVITWINDLDPVVGDAETINQPIPLGGMEEVSLFYNQSARRLRIMTPTDTSELFTDTTVWNLFLSDLNGDGVQEICATIRPNMLDRVFILDYANHQTYELTETEDYFYRLINREDALFVLQYDSYWNIVAYGQPVLRDGIVEIGPLDSRYQHLTQRINCVDINNRKMVCLSGKEEIDQIVTILEEIRAKQIPIPVSAWEENYAQSYWNANIVEINYEIGQDSFHFSDDYTLYWNKRENKAYRIADPEPIKVFVAEATNGVINRNVSGEPFASMDTPWDWCANMNRDAVVSARVEAKYHVTSSSVTGTNGVMSQKTLNQFVQILHTIPRSAFSADPSEKIYSFRDFLSGPRVVSSGVSIQDGINSLAVGFAYYNGQVRMLLTEETEQFDQGNYSYMTKYSLWNVDDAKLTEFMRSLLETKPVITYTVGAEYNWQKPLAFSAGDFTLELNLIEGWEYEYVKLADSSGIRIRPEGEKTGWIYFSYWPKGYHPVETDRYISEGMAYDVPSYTSYPSSVKTPTSFSTYHQIWSYRRFTLGSGDYAIINDGADDWFLQYEDQINDIDTLSRFQIES